MTRQACTRILAALCGCLPLAAAFAQGALKPVDALIVNPSSRPVPVAVQGEGSREIYKFTAILDGFGNSVLSCSGPQTLPTGKRLVLQHLGGEAVTFAPAALVYIAIRSPVDGLLDMVIPATPPVSRLGAGSNVSAAGQQVHAYIDGNFEVCAKASDFSATPVSVGLRGYLVNKP